LYCSCSFYMNSLNGSIRSSSS